ncbi:unnamed protein product [Lasius platythorax]|uniref:Uncharacterized protein n=1 Tax=Lasius platythorax TaxID=488582 RepID=A0AAV2NPE8_9HYME
MRSAIIKLHVAFSQKRGNSTKVRLFPNDPSAVANIDIVVRKPARYRRDTGESEKLDNQFAFNNPRSRVKTDVFDGAWHLGDSELPARKSACGLDALSSPRRWPRSVPVQDSRFAYEWFMPS